MKYTMIRTDIEVKARGEKGYLETVRLFKIRALKDFSDVKAGDFGGYIQDESNLVKKATVGYIIMLKCMMALKSREMLRFVMRQQLVQSLL